MSDSEDSDLEEGADVMRHQTKIIYQNQYPYIHMEPLDVIFERWTKIKPEVKKHVGHLMHVSVFWWHILLRQQDSHPTTFWAVEMGFLDSNVSNDLSLKRLEKIEILESILDAMERGLSHPNMESRARAVVSLSSLFSAWSDCLPEAIGWLRDSGAPDIGKKLLDLGSVEMRYRTLCFVFNEYSRYLQVISCSVKKAIEELKLEPDRWTLTKSEEMKNKGNEQFQKKKYDLALKWYTKAIKYHPSNHILYGNRALCYIRSEKYLKALGDGKRAVILQPDWAKGHYRFCDALFYLGEHQKALTANRLAQEACHADADGQKDLLQQYERFQTELQESKEMKTKKTETKKIPSKSRSHAAGDSSAHHVKSSRQPEATPQSSVPESSKSENWKDQDDIAGNSGARVHAEGRTDRLKDVKSEMSPRKTKKSSAGVPEKPTVRIKLAPVPDGPSHPVEDESEAGRKERFCAVVQEAHVALSDQRCRNAQQSFSVALKILESSGTTELGLTELDKSVLMYGYAMALLEIGQPEELAKAQQLLTKLESSERKFQLLVHYGRGRVYLKENRFTKALECFTNAQLMIQRHVTPGKLTWPTTKTTVEETQPDCLQEHLENFIEACKFPPKADAVCRYQHCLSHTVEIFFSDPDFKGFIQLTCCQSCRVEFHMSCWKKLKTLSFSDKNDKDFLRDSCFTPDCGGQVCHIVIYGSTGLIKCEFKTSIPKIRPAGRLRIKQQCTSIKKLKSKNERKLRRKQNKLATRSACQDKKEVTAAEALKDPAAQREPPKDTIYMDRVLHQIHDNKGLFKEESVNISCFLERLRPWLDLFESKGHESVLNSHRDSGPLSEHVDLLLESKNRVWARVFIETLASTLHIQPKLQHWAQQLDNAGLKAAESFINRYSSHLEELDLKPLLTFTPLQETLIEKFGTVPELFDSGGLTVMEYLRQAPAKEMRLFIWTLESNRERYQSCHPILDQYFEDDAVCLVIKKMDDDEHLSSVFKSKNRHRKKKQKEFKSVIMLSGMGGGHSRDEDEEDELFTEEDSLMFLHAMDPFSVPEHLRGQLVEFEEQYAVSAHRSHYERILDNNPDPTKESLYDYFAQILEEHGPLCASDPLMVGELENFPPEAQQKIADAGGLKDFLLESLRFVMTDELIGLMKHAVSLTDTRPSHLNPSAKEFWPHADALSQISFVSYESKDESGDSDQFLLLPDPYDLDYECLAADILADASASEEREDKYTAVCARDLGEHTDVSINTEPCVPFERNNGDMLQKEKQNLQLLKEIQQMKDDHEVVQQERAEEISVLQEETDKITMRMQIASTELSMFQQKLEEEVKKDQQEKKENQETLKTLKMEIKELADLNESYTRKIRVKSKEYQAELERLLDFGNQCASERSNLEEEIKRFRDACVKAQRRSTSAQLCVLQNRREHALRRLRMSVSEGKMVVKHLMEASPSFPSAVLMSAIDDWKRHVCDAEDKINRTQMEFEAQMDQVKKGTRLCSLPDICVPSVPTVPALPAILPPPVPQPPTSHFYGPHRSLPPTRTATPTGRGTPQPTDRLPEEPVSHRPSAPQHLTVYDRILERLHMMFPHYNRLVLNRFIQEVRSSSGGALNALTYDEVINRVAQLILDHQENARERMNITGGDAPGHTTTPSDAVRATGTPPLTHAWKRNTSEKHRNTALALNMEDPCIICHEDMSPEEVCVLECRHSFHRECIKSWLKEQSTCPTCREHALLPEDFPMLPGRQRKSHAPAAAFN
ncbi:E3 ubiquitin-protein ligase TTC3 isoform X2 [Labeo rohita]|uniref:E3 ubiquitin-protein ligase TTC3 isoform X2 n=1 Tax=Labeo rohita TaxID=84645 RepID=UPI0021E1FB55|nr:E3 ubiquitin-protein ligase TTC3 isoform X2 [Labeo rohita]XP_050977000.1 E3 ubiquitin-protein ligase TTC3 isoform X2 [Labeo rohita]XP_050977002.1 E3 ubiquitin-protein ligase TTC3 isoform X2 [Labeo rohita]XP_050977003.1 E3 ubiquitin-protein ligase TTC3 isoform X2 [Labeo rohita]XP_050977004.1 E3 ubiquitin-protein ligase TTC3 isoform X2 [Labeo rohita]